MSESSRVDEPERVAPPCVVARDPTGSLAHRSGGLVVFVSMLGDASIRDDAPRTMPTLPDQRSTRQNDVQGERDFHKTIFSFDERWSYFLPESGRALIEGAMCRGSNNPDPFFV